MNNPAPSISVVIPHLNQPENLRRCLASLHDQNFNMDRVEIIVVDNGSKVLPKEICEAFGGVILDREAAAGPGPARNRGVRLSSADILAFIDADCVADREWLCVIAAALGKGNDVVGGDVRIAIENPARLTMLEAYESVFAYRQQEYIERQGFSGTGNLAVHREIYDAVGPFAGIEVAEDTDWGRRATRMGYRIVYVPGMIVFHPARRTFHEIFAKWDRHVSHNFQEYVQRRFGRLQWLGLTIAVAGSPLFEARRIATSRRLSTWREKGLAATGMLAIRFYRVRKMLALLFKGANSGSSRDWNRT